MKEKFVAEADDCVDVEFNEFKFITKQWWVDDFEMYLNNNCK